MPTIELNPSELALLSALWGALWVVAGWWANHLFSSKRDRNERRLDFIDFLWTWKIEANECQQLSGFATNSFGVKKPIFLGKAARIRADFWRRKRFWNLCETINAMSPGKVGENKEGCQTFLTALDAVIAFVS